MKFSEPARAIAPDEGCFRDSYSDSAFAAVPAGFRPKWLFLAPRLHRVLIPIGFARAV
jgi:hypothetical protein